jgi:hypothetical protein
MVPAKIVGGDRYDWSCYGDNARYLDMENNVDVVFDEKTQEVYEICIREDSEDGVDSDIVWRSPVCESDYLFELKEKRKLSDADVLSKRANVHNVTEIIEKVKNLYEPGNIF